MLPIQDTVRTRRLPVATWLLVLTNIFVFLIELACPEPSLERIFYWFGVVPRRYTDPVWAAMAGFPRNNYWNLWPFLTSMFLHGGWVHVIGNMWMFWVFGGTVEGRMGPVRFLLFYLVCGVVASVVHVVLCANSTVPAIGASGAISGVLGAYFFLYPRAGVVVMAPVFFWPVFFAVPAVLYLGLWFVLQFFNGTLALTLPSAGGGIAWWAHVGGFLAGAVTYPLFTVGRRVSRPHRGEHGLAVGGWSRMRY